MRDSHSTRFSRRDAMRLLGIGAGLGFADSLGWEPDLAAALLQQAAPPGQALQLPRGAIIRTILKDIDPDAFTGITLMHEHLGNGRRPSSAAASAERPTDDPAWMADELTAVRK